MNDRLQISVVCSTPTHPVFAYLREWGRYDELCTSIRELSGGDILFLVSCTEIVPASVRALFRKTLVLHASNLPHGRGWSPHIWQLIEGRDELTLSLLEAEDPVDTGDIWKTTQLSFTGTELHHEINHALFRAELELMDWAIDHFSDVVPRRQSGTTSYYPRRTPEDSRIDPDLSIAEQFDLLRVSDP